MPLSWMDMSWYLFQILLSLQVTFFFCVSKWWLQSVAMQSVAKLLCNGQLASQHPPICPFFLVPISYTPESWPLPHAWKIDPSLAASPSVPMPGPLPRSPPTLCAHVPTAPVSKRICYRYVFIKSVVGLWYFICCCPGNMWEARYVW